MPKNRGPNELFDREVRVDLATRLNEIQEATGHASMRAFRESLLDKDFWRQRGKPRPSFSEEAMRNYHIALKDEGREPPSRYLFAVVERFDVNPSWLFTGEGITFMKDLRRAQAADLGEANHPLWRSALAGAPVLADWPTAPKVLFLDVLETYIQSYEGWAILVDDEDGNVRPDAVEALAADLLEMVDVTYHSIRPVDRRTFTQYMVALIHAVQIRLPDPGEGPHIYYRFPTLDPEQRERMRASLEGVPDAEALLDLDRPLTEVTPSALSEELYKGDGEG